MSRDTLRSLGLGRGRTAGRTGLRLTPEDLPHGFAAARCAFPPASHEGPRLSVPRVISHLSDVTGPVGVESYLAVALIYSSLVTDNVWPVSTCLLTISWENHLFKLFARF